MPNSATNIAAQAAHEDIATLDSVVKLPLMALPVRSVFVRTQNAGLLFSPGSQLTEAQLQSLSNVTDIIAPSLVHTAGMPKASQVLQGHRLWGPRGCTKVRPNVPWTHELNEQNWPYHNEVSAIALDGMPKIKEYAFIHHASKTLIACDLCFNMRLSGLGSWLILHFFGTYNRFAISRFWLSFTKDRQALKKSFARILEHDFERIVMSHGQDIVDNAKERLKDALAERQLR